MTDGFSIFVGRYGQHGRVPGVNPILYRDGKESIPGTGGLRYLYFNRDGGPAGLRQWSMGALVLRESLSRGVSTRGNRIHRAEKQSHTKRRDLYKT